MLIYPKLHSKSCDYLYSWTAWYPLHCLKRHIQNKKFWKVISSQVWTTTTFVSCFHDLYCTNRETWRAEAELVSTSKTTVASYDFVPFDETKINHITQHFFCVFHKKWTTSLTLKSQKFDEQSWYPPKLIELCMVAILWRHGLIKFDNCAGLAMFWTFRSHVRLNIVTVNLLESFSLHWSFYIWDRMAKNGPSKNRPERSDLP